MKNIPTVIRVFAIVVCSLAIGASLEAQATRTWVSGVGDDVNPCSRTAPCKTFAGAISKTAAGGEISVLDPGGFGAVTITKAITINGHNQVGSILAALVNGVTVNVTTNPSTATVYLHDLLINGAQSGLDGIRYLAGANLVVDDLHIYGFSGDGIEVAGAGNLNLKVNNTDIEDIAGDCIKMSTTSGQVVANIDNSRMQNCTGAGIKGVDRVRASVVNTTISHVAFGVQQTGTDTVFNLDDMFISFASSAGLRTTTAAIAGRIRVSDSIIAQSVLGTDFATGGNIDSFQGNSLLGNPGGNTFSSTTLKQ